jgi:hypothetical protein
MGKQFCETLSRKNLSQKRADGGAQGVVLEFNPSTAKQTNTNNNNKKP